MLQFGEKMRNDATDVNHAVMQCNCPTVLRVADVAWHMWYMWGLCDTHVGPMSFIWLVLWRCLHGQRLAQFEVFAVELSGAAAEAPHRRPCLGTVDRVWFNPFSTHLKKKNVPRFNHSHSIQFYIRKCWQNASSHYVWKVIKVYIKVEKVHKKCPLPCFRWTVRLWPAVDPEAPCVPLGIVWSNSGASQRHEANAVGFFCCALLPHSPRLHTAPRRKTWSRFFSKKTRPKLGHQTAFDFSWERYHPLSLWVSRFRVAAESDLIYENRRQLANGVVAWWWYDMPRKKSVWRYKHARTRRKEQTKGSQKRHLKSVKDCHSALVHLVHLVHLSFLLSKFKTQV